MLRIEAAEPRQFRFAVNGQEYAVPLLNDMHYSMIKALAEVRSSGDSYAILDWYVSEIFEKHAPGCTEALTFDQIIALLEAYDKECSTGE